uniref:Uncharacterized protein n=1 Tax=Arundo donax TaxID=35708 RepID=A0A0A8Y913_ARUDO
MMSSSPYDMERTLMVLSDHK